MALDEGTGVRPQPINKPKKPRGRRPWDAIEPVRQQQASERRTALRAPGRVRPDTITRQDRQKVNRVKGIDRLVNASIDGSLPDAAILRQMKLMTPEQLAYFSQETHRKGQIAEKQRTEAFTKPLLTAADKASEFVLGGKIRPKQAIKQNILSQGGILGGKEVAPPTRGSLASGNVNINAGIPFFWSGKAKQGIEDALSALPKGAAESLRASRTPVDEGMRLGAEEQGRLRKGEKIVQALKSERGSIGPVVVPGAKEAKLTKKAAKEAEALAGATKKAERILPGANPELPSDMLAVKGVLAGSRRVAANQKTIYRVERGAKAGTAQDAYEQAGGGEAGRRAALEALTGKHTRLEYPNKLLTRFGPESSPLRKEMTSRVDSLDDFIWSHPEMEGRVFDRIKAQNALKALMNGKSVTKSETKLLETLFSDPSAVKERSMFYNVVSLLSVPRTLRATYDLSFMFRQPLPFIGAEPGIWTKNLGPALKAFAREGEYNRAMKWIHDHPEYEFAEQAGLDTTDFEHLKLGSREEPYMGLDYAERIPLVKYGVRASARGYVAFLDLIRFQAFVKYHEANPEATDRELEDMARIINRLTGRGGLGSEKLEAAAPAAAGIFFSPRLMASRLALMNPAYYLDPRVTPAAKKMAARGMLSMIASGMTVLYLADKIPGVEVGLNPTSADFGRIRMGDWRLDVWGGFQPYVVAAWRLASGEYTSSTTNTTTSLTEGKFGQLNRYDVFTNLATGKLAPVPSYLVALMKGHGPGGAPFNPWSQAAWSFTPLSAESSYRAYNTQTGHRIAKTSATALLETVGFGTNTYSGRPSNSRKRGAKGGIKPSSGRSLAPKPGGRSLAPKPGSSSNKP